MKVKYTIPLFLVILLFSIKSFSQTPTDLFISEYVEGSSNNKALEFYNGTNATIDLGAGGYVIQMFFNGSATVGTTISLTGSIAPNSTFVLAQSSASFAGSAFVNQTNSSSWFNGDDLIILRKGGASGTIIDVIGQSGFDPGTEWGTGLTSTADNTLRRKTAICTGDINNTNVYDPSLEWDGFATDVFTGLGSHTSSCTSTGPSIILGTTSLLYNTPAGSISAEQSYTLQGNSLTQDITVTVPTLSNFGISTTTGGPYSSSLTISAAIANAGPVNLYVIFNPTATGTQSGNITHISGNLTGNVTVQGIATGSTGITRIFDIQGTASSSLLVGSTVTTEGVVIADFQGTTELKGFFIQDTTGDANNTTSDGIFVFYDATDVVIGDYVRVTGTVLEYFNKTQLTTVSGLTKLTTGNNLPVPVTINLPVNSITDLERFEGMRVQFPQTLTVSEIFTLGRFGEVSLSVNGRLINPTSTVDPNDNPASGNSTGGASNLAAVLAQQDLNNRSRILLDDGSTVQNPAVVPYVDAVNNTLRAGSTVTSLTGVLDYDFNNYRVHPTVAPTFSYSPRPAIPAVGLANLKIASFNVLNYFNGDGLGGGFPTSRGANTTAEFNRQRTKIIKAISELNADIVGLIEIENDGSNSNAALADLVNGLNAVMGANTYAYIIDPTPANGGTGTDAIKQALIYKPSVVTPFGLALADNNVVHNRPPIAQTFTLNLNNEKFTVVVNHFKSKSCSDATGLNLDQLDGQSCYNQSRKLQASALLTFINTLKISSGDMDIVAIGDFNAYEEEDPIDILRQGGLVKVPSGDYSYIFGGQTGTLDYIFVTNTLTSKVTGSSVWHINADEPIFKDYNTEFNPPSAYQPDAFRSSDHDPVLVGLNLQPAGFQLQILHASDFEAAAQAIVDAPNFAAVLDKLEDTYPNTIKLLSGDNVLPSPFSRGAETTSFASTLNSTYAKYYSTPAPLTSLTSGFARGDIAIMNFLGIDASALGNHEFDQGPADLRSFIAGTASGTNVTSFGAQFPYLSANLDFSTESSLSNIFTSQRLLNTAFRSNPTETTAAITTKPKIAPSTIIIVNGEKIGVVGVTTPILASISTVGNVKVKNPGAGTEDMQLLAQVIQPTIDELRNLEGINKVILLTQLQQLQNEKTLATFLKGVDVIVAGGSNTLMADATDRLRSGDVASETYPFITTDADGNPLAIVNTDGNYKYVGRLVIDFDQNGMIIPSSITPSVSGVFATDEQGVLDQWGNLTTPFNVGTKGNLVKQITDAIGSLIIAKDGNIIGKSSVWLEGRRNFVRTQETNLGNLTADANLWLGKFYDPATAISIKNGGGIRSEIGYINVSGSTISFETTAANPLSGKLQGEVSQLDIENSLRFNNTLSLVTVTAANLKAILEHAVRASTATATPGQFGQVGGVRYSYDRTLTPGARIRSAIIVDENNVTLDTLVKNGAVLGDTNRTFRVITLSFLADGGDGYPFPALATNRLNLTGIPEPGPAALNLAASGSEQDAFEEYLRFFHRTVPYNKPETPANLDERIQEIGVTRRDCIIPVPPNPGTYGPVSLTSSLVNLTGTPAGGTWSGTGVVNNTFNPAVGTQTLTYTVNLGGCSSSATVTIVVGNNLKPTVSIPSPVNNSSFPAGSNITINVNASDPDGSVSKVELFYNGIKLSEDLISPYEFSGTNVEAGVYKVTARAIDNSGDTTTTDTLTLTVNGCTASGSISGEGWLNIPGAAVASLTSNANYPNSPDITAELNVFEYQNIADNYGGRLRGYICAPQTGYYTFYISGDDQAGLYLSTNDDPANKSLIAYTETPTAFRQFNKFASQQSVAKFLVKGVRYYVETLQKEANNGDHLTVAWKLPNGNLEAPIAGSRLSPYLVSPAPILGMAGFEQSMRIEAAQRNEGQSLAVKALPNPSNSAFTLILKGNGREPVSITVTDAIGRVVESRANLQPNSTLQFGNKLAPGIYFLQATQGKERRLLKLIKE